MDERVALEVFSHLRTARTALESAAGIIGDDEDAPTLEIGNARAWVDKAIDALTPLVWNQQNH